VTASFVHDVANRRALPELVELARRGTAIRSPTLRRLAGRPVAPGDERLGEVWLAALLDLSARAGLGRLERDEHGEFMLVPAPNVPRTAEAAWDRAVRARDLLGIWP
jgi:hypothetical protein